MSRNEIHDAFPAYDFTDYIEKMKNRIDRYIEEKIKERKTVRNNEGDAMIDASAAKEAVKINEWYAQCVELVPRVSDSHKKKAEKEHEEAMRTRDGIIAKGKDASRELDTIVKAIDTIDRQLGRIPPVIENGSLYLRRWFPWSILLLVAVVDSFVLFNQFVDMRLSITDSVMSTIGVLLAVDLLAPLALIVFYRARLERTKSWVLAPVCIALAALIVTTTFVSVSDRNEATRSSLAVQIQQAEENGDIDGTLASLSKAYAELPTDRQILAKGLIPVVTTCVSLAVFTLNIPGALYLEKQRTLRKHRSRQEELEAIVAAGEEAAKEAPPQLAFNRGADMAMLNAEKEKLYQYALDELRKTTVELQVHFRNKISTTPVTASHSFA